MPKCRRKSSSPPTLTLFQNGIRDTVGAFDSFLCPPHFAHNIPPAGLSGSGHRLNPPDGPAIAGDDQRFALLKLVQNRLGFLVQLFCRDRAHGRKVTPQKCHRKFLSPRGGCRHLKPMPPRTRAFICGGAYFRPMRRLNGQATTRLAPPSPHAPASSRTRLGTGFWPVAWM